MKKMDFWAKYACSVLSAMPLHLLRTNTCMHVFPISSVFNRSTIFEILELIISDAISCHLCSFYVLCKLFTRNDRGKKKVLCIQKRSSVENQRIQDNFISRKLQFYTALGNNKICLFSCKFLCFLTFFIIYSLAINIIFYNQSLRLIRD